MADPLVVLLVLVGAASETAPRASPVASAIREALGEDATVMVEERLEAPSHEAAQELAVRLRASAVAELSWQEGPAAAAARAHVDMYLAADRAWHERDVGFDAADTRAERERALGLFLGALVRAASPEPVARPEPSPPSEPDPPPQAFAPAPPGERRVVPSPPPRSRWTLAPEAAFASSALVGGDATGLGPAIGLDAGRGFLGARASGAVRFGRVPELDASTSLVRLGLGPRARLFTTAGEDVAVTVAVEGLLLHHVVTRSAPAETHSRWVGGALASARVTWKATTWLAPFAALGLETAFGDTPLDLDGRTVATLPVARTTLDLGVSFPLF